MERIRAGTDAGRMRRHSLIPVPGFATLLIPALAVAVASAGGIAFPEIYARETASWAAQGIGQDVVNLVVIVPLLVVAAWKARGAFSRWTFIVAGLLLYVAYSYVLYAFCVHFNRLFLVYCAALGSSIALLIRWSAGLGGLAGAWTLNRRCSTRWPAAYLTVTAAGFACLWLAEDLPALRSGLPPASLGEAGLVTNPVHVLDLSCLLPAMAWVGIQFHRRQPAGYLLFPVMLTFGAAMGAAIGGMMIVMLVRCVGGNPVVACAFAVVTVVDAGLLVHVLTRQLVPARIRSRRS